MPKFQTNDSIQVTFEMLGQLGAEIAYMICPNTFRLYRLCSLYDNRLPDKPLVFEYDDIQGNKQTVSIKRGIILDSDYLRFILNGSFWAEFNQNLVKLPTEQAMAVAAAVKASLEKSKRDIKTLDKERKVFETFLKENGQTMDEFNTWRENVEKVEVVEVTET